MLKNKRIKNAHFSQYPMQSKPSLKQVQPKIKKNNELGMEARIVYS